MKTQEQLKRDMYAALDKIRRAKKHPSATAVFETALEAYLESVRAQAMTATAEQLLRERDDLQARLHAVDTAYAESQELNRIAGEELRRAQAVATEWKGQARQGYKRIGELNGEVTALKKIKDEHLIVIKSQREAFGELYVKHHTQQRPRNCNGPAPLVDASGKDGGWCCTAYQQ